MTETIEENPNEEGNVKSDEEDSKDVEEAAEAGDDTPEDEVEVEEEIEEEAEDEFEFLQSDNDNFSLYQAFKAFHDDRDYEAAIGQFEAAIKYEEKYVDSPDDDTGWTVQDAEEVIAKSLYWLGESYLKAQQTDKAIDAFERLFNDFNSHYLSVAAERRIDTLKSS